MQQEHAEGRGGLLSFSPSAHPQDFFLCPNKLAPATQASLRGRRSKGKGKGIKAKACAPKFPLPLPLSTQASCSNGLLHSARTKIQLHHCDRCCFLDNKGQQPCFTSLKMPFHGCYVGALTRKRLLGKSLPYMTKLPGS